MCYLQNTEKSNKHLLFSSCTVVKQPEIAFHFSSPDMLRTTRPLEMSASPELGSYLSSTFWLAIYANQNLMNCAFSIRDWHGSYGM